MRKSKYKKYKEGGAAGGNQIGSDTLQAFSTTSSGLNRVSETIDQSAEIPEGYNDDQEDVIDTGVQAAASFTPTRGIITKGGMVAGDSVNKALGADTYGGAIAGDSIKYTAAGAEMGMALGGPYGAAAGGAVGLGYGVYSGINDKNNLEQAQKEALREEIKNTRRSANRTAKRRGQMYRNNNNYSSEIYAKKGAAIDLHGGKAKKMNSNSFSLSGNKHEESKIDNTSGIKIPSIKAEAEDKETVTKDNNQAFIFSDHLKDTDGKSFSKKHKKIANAIGKAEKSQKHKPNDPYVMSTIKRLRDQENKLKLKQLLTQEIEDEENNKTGDNKQGFNTKEINQNRNQEKEVNGTNNQDLPVMRRGGYVKYRKGTEGKLPPPEWYNTNAVTNPSGRRGNSMQKIPSKPLNINDPIETDPDFKETIEYNSAQSSSGQNTSNNIQWDRVANKSEKILPYVLQTGQYLSNRNAINEMPLQQERYPMYEPSYLPENRRDRLATQRIQESGRASREGIRQSSAANQVASQSAMLGKELDKINQATNRENRRLDQIQGKNVNIANAAAKYNVGQENRRFSDLQTNKWMQTRQQVANRDNFVKSFLEQQRQEDLRDLDMSKFEQMMAADVNNVSARKQFNSNLGDKLYYTDRGAWKSRVREMLQSENEATREAGQRALDRHNLTVEDL